MLDPRFLLGYLLVGLAAALTIATILTVGLSRPGSRRAGLIAGGLPLALLPLPVATVYASWTLTEVFSEMSQLAEGTSSAMLETCAALWRLERFGFGAIALTCLLGLVLGFLRFGPASADIPCSGRRAFALLTVPLLGLLVMGFLTRQMQGTLRVTAAVIAPGDGDVDDRKRSAAVLESYGLDPERIGRISEWLARSLLAASFGGFAALGVLLGLAIPGFILAWRAGFGRGFALAAGALWFLAGAWASLLGLGAFDPLRLP